MSILYAKHRPPFGGVLTTKIIIMKTQYITTNNDIAKDELHDYLLSWDIATEKEISLVTSINGYNLEALEGILYSRTGYRDLEQAQECM